MVTENRAVEVVVTVSVCPVPDTTDTTGPLLST